MPALGRGLLCCGQRMPESLSRSRLDSLSDGVIAVILTIMVLELKVPSRATMSTHDALLGEAKIFAIYLLSFVQVGIYWVNHHYLLDDVETITHGLLWANLGLLFTLSLVPFGLEWIGSRGIAPAPVAVYAVCFLLPALAWSILANVIGQQTRVPPAAGLGRQAFSSGFTLAAAFVAFASPTLALFMIATVTAVWLVPPRRIVEKTRALQAQHTGSPNSS